MLSSNHHIKELSKKKFYPFFVMVYRALSSRKEQERNITQAFEINEFIEI
jgi:hypothetical protein